MIPDLQASVMCDDVRQERNGKFMLIGIFDGLVQAVNQPVCPRICLMNRWCAGEGEFTQKSRIVAPDGVPLGAGGKRTRHRVLPAARLLRRGWPQARAGDGCRRDPDGARAHCRVSGR